MPPYRCGRIPPRRRRSGSRCARSRDAYGFGPERMQRFFEALQANTDELEKMKADVDEEYAYEKLRLKAERVTGMHIEYLFEKDALAAQLGSRKP